MASCGPSTRCMTSNRPTQYCTVIWCPDCTGVDFEGCFDGGIERLGPFATREAAKAAGDKYTRDGIWQFDIEEVDY